MESQDGLIQVLSGKVQIKDPVGEGRPALLRPGKDLKLIIDGQLVGGPTSVWSHSQIEVQPPQIQPQSRLDLSVSRDKLTADLSWQAQPGEIGLLKEQVIPVSELTLEIGARSPIHPEPPRYSQAIELLKEQGISYGVREEALREWIDGEKKESLEVARGIAPRPGKHGEVKYLFSREEMREIDLDSMESINHYERRLITSVKQGERLAQLIPPVPGEAGIDIYSQSVPPPPVRPAEIRAGKGVEVSPDGQEAYASIAGHVQVDAGRINVSPVYTIQGDVDLSTGNITFHGNVVVTGDLTENTRVRAGGGVEVLGMVSSASIEANGPVQIHQNAIGGRVVAGLEEAARQHALPHLESLTRGLRRLLDALLQMREHPDAQFLGEWQGSTDGYLFKLLLEKRYTKLIAAVEELHRQVDGTLLGQNDDWRRMVRRVRKLFLGRGPLEISGYEELEEHHDFLMAFWSEQWQNQGNSSGVNLRYMLNTTVEAAGDVLVQYGAYNSHIMAGGGVKIQGAGFFRGGSIQVVVGDVVLKDLGTPAGCLTSVEILKEGELWAETVYPNTQVSIGGMSTTFEREQKKVRVYLEEGVLRVGESK